MADLNIDVKHGVLIGLAFAQVAEENGDSPQQIFLALHRLWLMSDEDPPPTLTKQVADELNLARGQTV